MSKDEMRKEYDFRGGVRGKHFGKVTGTRVIKANPSKPEPKASGSDDEQTFEEAISLLMRSRTYLKGGERAQELRDEIDEFLERQAS